MKTCPYCGGLNATASRLCRNCDADIAVLPQKSATDPGSALEARVVKFFLYLHCILIPCIGFVIGLLIAATPFSGQKELSARLLTCAAIASTVWLVLALIGCCAAGLTLAL